MKTVVSISGGKSSAFIAANYDWDIGVFAVVRIEDDRCQPKDPIIKKEFEERTGVEFIATAEPDESILAVLDIEQMLGKSIQWVSGPTFDELIRKKGDYLPNRTSRYCTTELKIYPIWQYIQSLGEYPCNMLIGFRAGEEKRAENVLNKCLPSGFEESKLPIGKHKNGNTKWGNVAWRKPVFPLITDRVYKDHVDSYWKGKPIRFPKRNNCVGCFWRNPLLLSKMNQAEPEKFNWFASKEGKGRWRKDSKYAKIQKFKAQLALDIEEFSDCDTGFCIA